MTPEERRERFNKLKSSIAGIIKRTIDKREVIQGERAVEAQVPDQYRRETRDFDVYSSNPERSAKETERELDWEFGGNYFRTKLAQHKGTVKVVSNIDDETWADYTKPSEKIYKTKIGNTNYTTLQFELFKAKRILQQKQYAYRHKKEQDKIKRINAALAMQKSMSGKKRMRWL